MVSSDQFRNLLLHHCAGQFHLNEYHLERLVQYFICLQKGNKKIDLTSLEKVEEIVLRHFCESIALGFSLPFGKLHIMDFGSGAGFPGIPLAIVRPDCFIYLVEAEVRKAMFLTDSSLRLMNAVVLPQMIQDVEHHVDWAVCRGLAWEEIQPSVERLADHVVLMVAEDTVSAITRSASIQWDEPQPSAWGTGRVLLTGKVSGVPRETSSA